MEFELKGALKKYRQMRWWRRFWISTAIPISFAIPWFLNFGKTDTLICVAMGVVVWGVGETELRLKTIQVRLAGMNDQLNQLRGDHDAASDVILELNDW